MLYQLSYSHHWTYNFADLLFLLLRIQMHYDIRNRSTPLISPDDQDI